MRRGLNVSVGHSVTAMEVTKVVEVVVVVVVVLVVVVGASVPLPMKKGFA